MRESELIRIRQIIDSRKNNPKVQTTDNTPKAIAEPKFKVGHEFFFHGQKAKITQVNADGTYNFEYSMEIFKGQKFYCANVSESILTKTN